MDDYQMMNNQMKMQSALQQQQTSAEQSMAGPYLQQQQQQVSAALVEQINPDRIIADLQMKLRGYKEKYDGSWERSGIPLMNDNGVMTMVTYASSVVNQHTIMSSFDNKQVAKIMITLMEAIIDDLTLNWKEYDIKNKTHLDIIHNMMMITCFSALNRALAGGERRFLGTTTIENISTMPKMPNIKKEGFLSRFRL